MDMRHHVRPEVWEMAGYVPGEQDPTQSLLKLNTNENPFEPPIAVKQAIVAATGNMLRRYPDPSSRPVREAAASVYGLDAAQIVVGNGSDDILTILIRTFVAPGACVTVPEPTYGLYHTLAQIQGCRFVGIPWEEGWRLPRRALRDPQPSLIFVVRPNAPTGHVVPLTEVARLCQETSGMVVVDEAYVDFADDTALLLLANHPNLIITRTFSKSFSLAGMRIGLAFAHPDVAAQMHKVRDSYNVNYLSQVAAVAALEQLPHYQPLWQTIRGERQRLTEALRQRGFQVPESQANFVLAQVPVGPWNGQRWFEALKQAGILVRHFGSDPHVANHLRITIGRTEEMDQLLDQIDQIDRHQSPDHNLGGSAPNPPPGGMIPPGPPQEFFFKKTPRFPEET